MATERIQNKNISRLNLCVGQSWNNANIKDKFINSVFQDIDDGDGIIQDNELVILNKSVDIRKKASPQQAFEKINYADYTKEELIKRYPPNKFEVTEKKENNSSVISITDKSSNIKVLEVTTKHGEDKTTIIEENNSKGELIMRRCYDEEGKLNCYDDNNVRHNPIADLLYDDVCAKDSFGLPTTNPKIEEHVKLIKPKDVLDVLDNYEQRFGETFENSMNGERWLKKDIKGKEVKNRIMKHLTECLEKAYGYNKNYKNENSVISNSNHKGAVYSVIQNGDEIVITNKSNNKVKKLNLEKLTNKLPLKQKVQMKTMLQKLPGEILEDIASEGIKEIRTHDLKYTVNQNSANKKDDLRKTEDEYLRRGDDVIFDNSSDFNSLIPKIGLSLNYAGYFQNSTVEKNKDFMSTFEKELETYKNDGNTRQLDAKKLFSECYTYLVTGDSEYKDVIEKYFRQTLQQSDNHIAKIRQMETYNRRVSKV